jgi:hypothetical protein
MHVVNHRFSHKHLTVGKTKQSLRKPNYNMFPNPANLMKGKAELPEVEQLGKISLDELHEYNCNNPQRRLLSLFGDVFDVTSSEKSYGKDGAYKEYAGHDITLGVYNSITKAIISNLAFVSDSHIRNFVLCFSYWTYENRRAVVGSIH